MIERAGTEAKLGFKAHPHMLRYACGYALANKGYDTRALQAYLGHKNIQHTVCYTELSLSGPRKLRFVGYTIGPERVRATEDQEHEQCSQSTGLLKRSQY